MFLKCMLFVKFSFWGHLSSKLAWQDWNIYFRRMYYYKMNRFRYTWDWRINIDTSYWDYKGMQRIKHCWMWFGWGICYSHWCFFFLFRLWQVLMSLFQNLLISQPDNCRESSSAECIFVLLALNFECQFNKNTLLQYYFL